MSPPQQQDDFLLSPSGNDGIDIMFPPPSSSPVPSSIGFPISTTLAHFFTPVHPKSKCAVVNCQTPSPLKNSPPEDIAPPSPLPPSSLPSRTPPSPSQDKDSGSDFSASEKERKKKPDIYELLKPKAPKKAFKTGFRNTVQRKGIGPATCTGQSTQQESPLDDGDNGDEEDDTSVKGHGLLSDKAKEMLNELKEYIDSDMKSAHVVNPFNAYQAWYSREHPKGPDVPALQYNAIIRNSYHEEVWNQLVHLQLGDEDGTISKDILSNPVNVHNAIHWYIDWYMTTHADHIRYLKEEEKYQMTLKHVLGPFNKLAITICNNHNIHVFGFVIDTMRDLQGKTISCLWGTLEILDLKDCFPININEKIADFEAMLRVSEMNKQGVDQWVPIVSDDSGGDLAFACGSEDYLKKHGKWDGKNKKAKVVDNDQDNGKGKMKARCKQLLKRNKMRKNKEFNRKVCCFTVLYLMPPLMNLWQGKGRAIPEEDKNEEDEHLVLHKAPAVSEDEEDDEDGDHAIHAIPPSLPSSPMHNVLWIDLAKYPKTHAVSHSQSQPVPSKHIVSCPCPHLCLQPQPIPPKHTVWHSQPPPVLPKTSADKKRAREEQQS
ncbi:hypothetical protein Moror_12126 [Moniliophthora roreri MCA 2997]|uniref:Uncharacterized protein n=1 Tax=Moniliophthora roreri (strain MCA 2997) TaxID=1381753 RepID=V2W3D1_MONRO|nr:hypothetical protein Moror_12126 [Moniliophthora roreri MCA 2997]